MSRKTYPRWGGMEKLPEGTGKVCWQCEQPATRQAEIRVSHMRGDDHDLFPLCSDNTCRDALKDCCGLVGEARHK
jgi:hypothetical protein